MLASDRLFSHPSFGGIEEVALGVERVGDCRAERLFAGFGDCAERAAPLRRPCRGSAPKPHADDGLRFGGQRFLVDVQGSLGRAPPGSRGFVKRPSRPNVPGLYVNERVIESSQRTPAVARTSGGVVGALAPYLRSHVTGFPDPPRAGELFATSIRRCAAWRPSYGVDPAVLLAICGLETSYGLRSPAAPTSGRRSRAWAITGAVAISSRANSSPP